MRAAIMGSLLALAPALGRRYDIYSALALAALAKTAVEPLLIHAVGFQFTMLATAGIPLLTPTFQRWLLSAVPRAARASLLVPVAELLAVTWAAQSATLPVLALAFGQVSLIAPLANLLAVPLLAPLLVLGGALTCAALCAPYLALLLAFVTWPLLWLMDLGIEVCAAVPGATVSLGAAPSWLPAIYYAILIGSIGVVVWVTHRRVRTRAPAGAVLAPAHAGQVERASRAASRLLQVGVAVAVPLVACGATAPALVGTSARLDFLDVGPGGEAALLRLSDGTTVLIDGGPSGPALASALSGRLPLWQRSLDLVLLTDPRPGDATGLQDAAGHFAIGRAADAGMLHPTAPYLAWLDALARAGALHSRIRQDDLIRISPSTTFRVRGPPQTLYLPHGGATTQSNDLILRLDAPGIRVLFLGSADGYALDALAFSGEPLGADIVAAALPPNGGLDLGGSLGAILRAAHPRLVVVTQAPAATTAQARRAPGAADAVWPPDEATAQALGAVIMRTSSVGTVSLRERSDGGWDLQGA